MTFYKPEQVVLHNLVLGNPRMNGNGKTVSILYSSNGQEESGLGLKLPFSKIIWEPSAAPGSSDTGRLTLCLQVSDSVADFVKHLDKTLIEKAAQHSVAIFGKVRSVEDLTLSYKSLLSTGRLGNSLKSKLNTTGPYEVVIRNDGRGGTDWPAQWASALAKTTHRMSSLWFAAGSWGITMNLCDVSLRWLEAPPALRPNPFQNDSDEEMVDAEE